MWLKTKLSWENNKHNVKDPVQSGKLVLVNTLYLKSLVAYLLGLLISPFQRQDNILGHICLQTF